MEQHLIHHGLAKEVRIAVQPGRGEQPEVLLLLPAEDARSDAVGDAHETALVTRRRTPHQEIAACQNFREILLKVSDMRYSGCNSLRVYLQKLKQTAN